MKNIKEGKYYNDYRANEIFSHLIVIMNYYGWDEYNTVLAKIYEALDSLCDYANTLHDLKKYKIFENDDFTKIENKLNKLLDYLEDNDKNKFDSLMEKINEYDYLLIKKIKQIENVKNREKNKEKKDRGINLFNRAKKYITASEMNDFKYLLIESINNEMYDEAKELLQIYIERNLNELIMSIAEHIYYDDNLNINIIEDWFNNSIFSNMIKNKIIIKNYNNFETLKNKKDLKGIVNLIHNLYFKTYQK
jgi:hypothetical protein